MINVIFSIFLVCFPFNQKEIIAEQNIDMMKTDFYYQIDLSKQDRLNINNKSLIRSNTLFFLESKKTKHLENGNKNNLLISDEDLKQRQNRIKKLLATNLKK